MLKKGNALADETSWSLMVSLWQDEVTMRDRFHQSAGSSRAPFPALTHHQTKQIEDAMPMLPFSL